MSDGENQNRNQNQTAGTGGATAGGCGLHYRAAEVAALDESACARLVAGGVVCWPWEEDEADLGDAELERPTGRNLTIRPRRGSSSGGVAEGADASTDSESESESIAPATVVGLSSSSDRVFALFSDGVALVWGGRGQLGQMATGIRHLGPIIDPIIVMNGAVSEAAGAGRGTGGHAWVAIATASLGTALVTPSGAVKYAGGLDPSNPWAGAIPAPNRPMSIGMPWIASCNRWPDCTSGLSIPFLPARGALIGVVPLATAGEQQQQ